jgi:hypothetical protein
MFLSWISLVRWGDLNVTNWASKLKNQKPLWSPCFVKFATKRSGYLVLGENFFLFLQVTAERLAGTDQRDDDSISKTWQEKQSWAFPMRILIMTPSHHYDPANFRQFFSELCHLLFPSCGDNLGCELHNRIVEIHFTTQAGDAFLLHWVAAGVAAHPAIYLVGSGDAFSGG